MSAELKIDRLFGWRCWGVTFYVSAKTKLARAGDGLIAPSATFVSDGLSEMIIRPRVGWIGLIGYPADRREKSTIAFFGIREVGTFYDLAYGINHMDIPDAERLWGLAGLTALCSILRHKLTVTPIMRSPDRKRGRNPDADDDKGAKIQ